MNNIFDPTMTALARRRAAMARLSFTAALPFDWAKDGIFARLDLPPRLKRGAMMGRLAAPRGGQRGFTARFRLGPGAPLHQWDGNGHAWALMKGAA